MEELIKELRSLILDLDQFSDERMGQSVSYGAGTVPGALNGGVSLGYSNASKWLNRILDSYES